MQQMLKIKLCLSRINNRAEQVKFLIESNPQFVLNFIKCGNRKSIEFIWINSKLVNQIARIISSLKLIKEEYIDRNLFDWKRQQQNHRIYIRLNSVVPDLQDIQNSYDMLIQTFWMIMTTLDNLIFICRYEFND